jgi:predicted NUDIX family phosphoesterase
MAAPQINHAVVTLTEKMAEQVLVVSRQSIQDLLPTKGIALCDELVIKQFVELNATFLARQQAENDPAFKQIIPYLVFCYGQQLFLMQRSAHASEQRLASKLSLGIGGHLKAQDLAEQELFTWAKREFLEEVTFSGGYTQTFIGIINDENSAAGQVHTGLLWLLKADSPEIAIKDEHVSGQLVSLEYCQQHYAQLESWSQLVIDYLSQQPF